MHKVVFTDNVLEDGTNLSYIVQGEVYAIEQEFIHITPV